MGCGSVCGFFVYIIICFVDSPVLLVPLYILCGGGETLGLGQEVLVRSLGTFTCKYTHFCQPPWLLATFLILVWV